MEKFELNSVTDALRARIIDNPDEKSRYKTDEEFKAFADFIFGQFNSEFGSAVRANQGNTVEGINSYKGQLTQLTDFLKVVLSDETLDAKETIALKELSDEVKSQFEQTKVFTASLELYTEPQDLEKMPIYNAAKALQKSMQEFTTKVDELIPEGMATTPEPVQAPPRENAQLDMGPSDDASTYRGNSLAYNNKRNEEMSERPPAQNPAMGAAEAETPDIKKPKASGTVPPVPDDLKIDENGNFILSGTTNLLPNDATPQENPAPADQSNNTSTSTDAFANAGSTTSNASADTGTQEDKGRARALGEKKPQASKAPDPVEVAMNEARKSLLAMGYSTDVVGEKMKDLGTVISAISSPNVAIGAIHQDIQREKSLVTAGVKQEQLIAHDAEMKLRTEKSVGYGGISTDILSLALRAAGPKTFAMDEVTHLTDKHHGLTQHNQTPKQPSINSGMSFGSIA